MTEPRQLVIQENVPLAPFTTLRIGGPARYFTGVENEQQLEQAFEYADVNDLEVFILGGGSNILVSDRGFDGLVVQIALKGIEQSESAAAWGDEGGGARNEKKSSDSYPNLPPKCLISAAAGEDWDRFVAYCISQDLSGLECLSGIPGFVGGTPVQNVGAYGQEVSETIVSVRCFDRLDRNFVDLSNADIGFSYRRSIFNTIARDRYVVLEVRYALAHRGRPKIGYKDLRDYFGLQKPTLAETREAILQIRRAKSMVIDPEDPNSRSAGSFFKNPIVRRSMLDRIASAAECDTFPSFKVDEISAKIPAAWLIEQSGFHKGFRLGNAGISTNHSLALINAGGASAAELIALMELIQSRVEDKFGIRLQPEPMFVGF